MEFSLEKLNLATSPKEPNQVSAKVAAEVEPPAPAMSPLLADVAPFMPDMSPSPSDVAPPASDVAPPAFDVAAVVAHAETAAAKSVQLVVREAAVSTEAVRRREAEAEARMKDMQLHLLQGQGAQQAAQAIQKVTLPPPKDEGTAATGTANPGAVSEFSGERINDAVMMLAMRDARDHANHANFKLQAEVARLQSELNASKSQLQDLTQESHKLRQVAKFGVDAAQKISEFETQVQDLKHQLKEVGTENSVLAANKRQVEMVLESIKAKHSKKLEGRMESAEETVVFLEAKLEVNQKFVNEQQDHIHALEAALQKSEESDAAAQASVEDLKQRNNLLIAEMAARKDQRLNVQEFLTKLTAMEEELQIATEKLNEYQPKAAKADEIQAELDAAVSKVQDLTNDKKKLECKLAEAGIMLDDDQSWRYEVNHLMAENASLLEKCSQFERRLENVYKELQFRPTSQKCVELEDAREKAEAKSQALRSAYLELEEVLEDACAAYRHASCAACRQKDVEALYLSAHLDNALYFIDQSQRDFDERGAQLEHATATIQAWQTHETVYKSEVENLQAQVGDLNTNLEQKSSRESQAIEVLKTKLRESEFESMRHMKEADIASKELAATKKSYEERLDFMRNELNKALHNPNQRATELELKELGAGAGGEAGSTDKEILEIKLQKMVHACQEQDRVVIGLECALAEKSAQLEQAKQEVAAAQEAWANQAAFHKQQLRGMAETEVKTVMVEDKGRVQQLVQHIGALEAQLAEQQVEYTALAEKAEKVVQWASDMETKSNNTDSARELKGAHATIARLKMELSQKDMQLQTERQLQKKLAMQLQGVTNNPK